MIALRRLAADELRAIAAGRMPFGGIEVPEGGLPPLVAVERAVAALQGGVDPAWSAIYVALEGGRLVGSGGFKGSPAEDRSVEIGYNVAHACRGRGVATGIAGRLAGIAFADPRVDAVRAETLQDNVASRRVLAKCGFVHAGQRASVDEGIVDRWVLARPPVHERRLTSGDGE